MKRGRLILCAVSNRSLAAGDVICATKCPIGCTKWILADLIDMHDFGIVYNSGWVPTRLVDVFPATRAQAEVYRYQPSLINQGNCIPIRLDAWVSTRCGVEVSWSKPVPCDVRKDFTRGNAESVDHVLPTRDRVFVTQKFSSASHLANA